MKDFRGMKRQRSRNRKPSGNSNNPNRAYESNGPEGTKARGNAQTIYEKYQQLARDANSAGDRVLAENHLQHAEHYFRLIRQMQPQRPVSEFVQRDPFSNGFDDFDDEIETEIQDNQEAETASEDAYADEGRSDNRSENRDNRDNRDRYRNDRNGNDRGNDRGNGDRNTNGRDRDRNRDGRDRNEPRSFEPRNNEARTPEPRNNEPRTTEPRESEFDADGNRRETRRERYERRRAQRLNEQEQVLNSAPGFIASTEPLGGAAPRAVHSETARVEAAPEAVAAEAPVAREPRARRARTEDDASHLPAFLRAPVPGAAAAEPEDAPAKPKRTRRRKAEDEVNAEQA